MSLDIAKLRLLQRQAGRAVADEGAMAPAGQANLPQPLFFKEENRGARPGEHGSVAGVAELVDLPATRSVSTLPATDINDAATRESKAPIATRPPHTDVSAPLFAKEGPGEIRSARSNTAASSLEQRERASQALHPPGSNASAPLFAKEGLGEICPPLSDTGTPLFGKDGLPEIRSARPDLDALRRLIAQRERKPGTSPLPQAPASASAARPAPAPGPIDRSVPGQEISPGLYFSEIHLRLPVPQAALSLAFAKRPDDALDPRRLMFFDTETTGLAGGTGTRAFMIGAADWHRDAVHGDGLRIRQLTIATLAAEPAMLRAFAQWLGPDTVLSSYNGRCYDAPLLNTRYRLARIANPLAGLDHVDLLFPTRRLYRGVWENCKLATIERELLRIVREDDLPGSQAPAAWLHYLRGGSSALLRRVAAHNHQDVVTLAQLMLKLVEAQAALPV
ncbi:ribonuclease H-like domain-containing protein [Lysobacter antibioticus]|uniref:ribonuclease H-like domain-containing protein n=1 Tax=Lysobacter antibioticus TaxID=84531 RepID=UPI00200C67FE|nr:ribonuclease H-like domain-containing protein [Lysobacter antibioticus]